MTYQNEKLDWIIECAKELREPGLSSSRDFKYLFLKLDVSKKNVELIESYCKSRNIELSELIELLITNFCNLAVDVKMENSHNPILIKRQNSNCEKENPKTENLRKAEEWYKQQREG